MTSEMMIHFSYASALILFLLGIVNIVFAWKTHSYLYTADIKRQTIVAFEEHAALAMMALDRSPSPIGSPTTETRKGSVEKRKSITFYLLMKE